MLDSMSGKSRQSDLGLRSKKNKKGEEIPKKLVQNNVLNAGHKTGSVKKAKCMWRGAGSYKGLSKLGKAKFGHA